jgi:hypothetical protein
VENSPTFIVESRDTASRALQLLKRLQSLAIEIAIKVVIADCNRQLRMSAPIAIAIAIDFELFLTDHTSSFWCDGDNDAEWPAALSPRARIVCGGSPSTQRNATQPPQVQPTPIVTPRPAVFASYVDD